MVNQNNRFYDSKITLNKPLINRKNNNVLKKLHNKVMNKPINHPY